MHLYFQYLYFLVDNTLLTSKLFERGVRVYVCVCVCARARVWVCVHACECVSPAHVCDVTR